MPLMVIVHCTKKRRFPLRTASVNVTKLAGNCGFGHIYLRNPKGKTSFFVQWHFFSNIKYLVLIRLFLLKRKLKYCYTKNETKVMNRISNRTKTWISIYRNNHLDVFLQKVVMKICNKFTEEHLCRSVIAIKLLWNFIKTTFRHRYCSINLLHIFRTPFPKNTSGGLLLYIK